jgi:glycosyltransferase involved in cell wall biosynthesis
LTDDYARGAGGFVRRIGLGAIRSRFQAWDRRTAVRVTQFLANSEFTAQRIKRFYGRDAAVVHPPVRTTFFTPDPDKSREDYLLIVSALEPYKRVDLAIEAANRSNFPLIIIGDGSQRRVLESLAGPTVKFLGRASDEILRDQYRCARALLFPQVEDFGIVAAEAQSSGCPVIAYASSGAADIVRPGTGILMSEQSEQAILNAIPQLESTDAGQCAANASRFSEAEFDRKIGDWVSSLVASGS